MADKKFVTAKMVDGRPLANVGEYTISMREDEPSPVDLLVASAAGCASLTLQAILEKKRITVEELKVDIEATYSEDRPRRLVTMDMKYTVRAPGLDQDALESSMEIAERYCPVAQTLLNGAKINAVGEVVN
ncbi:MAG: OsmC family protein [Clostridia bacterium]